MLASANQKLTIAVIITIIISTAYLVVHVKGYCSWLPSAHSNEFERIGVWHTVTDSTNSNQLLFTTTNLHG